MSQSSDNRTLLTEFTITRRTLLEWSALGTGATVVAAVVFTAIYGMGTGRSSIGFRIGSPDTAIVGFFLFGLSIVGVIVVHEAIHAVVLRYYGGDVSYGVGLAGLILPYAYVTTTRRLTRNQFIVVALAPLVAITLVGIPLMLLTDAAILVVPLALNAGGAIGDLWMACVLRRYPPHVTVEDSKTGMRIYGSSRDDPLAPATTRTFLHRVALGSAVGFGALIVAVITTALLLISFGVSSFTLGVPDTLWTVFAVESGPDGFGTSINAAGTVIVSLLLGVGYAVTSASRPPS